MSEPIEQKESEKPDEANEPEEQNAMSVQAAGLLVIAVGLICCGIFMGYPLYRAHSGAEVITIVPKFILGSLAILGMGIVALCGLTFVEDENNIKITDILILLVVGAMGVAAYYFFQTHIESLGYQFPDF